METQELMQNNYVLYKGTVPCKVVYTDPTATIFDTVIEDKDGKRYDVWARDLTPINLDQDTFIKFGFEMGPGGYYLMSEGRKKCLMGVIEMSSGNYSIGALDFKYLHQLQNFLNILGVKKNVTFWGITV